MYEVEFTAEARDDLKALRKADQVTVLTEIETQLIHQPRQETRKRKKLRPNPIAEWELRIGQFRVFDNADPNVQESASRPSASKSAMCYSFEMKDAGYENDTGLRPSKDAE